MSTRLLRWMAQAWTVVNCIIIAYFFAGMVLETIAGMGHAARNTALWAILHPGFGGHLAVLVLLGAATTLTLFARRALRRREAPPMAGNHASTSA